MNSKLGLLGALLVFQFILVGVALMAPLGGDDAPGQLLSFASAEVDRVSVSDGEATLDVTRAGDDWQVSGVAADADKVTEFLAKLGAMDPPWPVATSSASAARFEVSADNYQRHVRLYAAEEVVADVYLGTSPGFQKVHARRADSDEVFSVALSNYEVGVTVDDWLDKAVLAMAAAPVDIELTLPSSTVETLQNTDEGWLYNGTAADQDEAATYANRFTTLRVLGLAGAETEVDWDAVVEQGRVVVANADEQQTLVISRAGEEDSYFITALGSDTVYRLATYTAEQLLMADANFSMPEPESTVQE